MERSVSAVTNTRVFMRRMVSVSHTVLLSRRMLGDVLWPPGINTLPSLYMIKVVTRIRDIAPGQLIFREEASAVGPNHDTPPLCLSCLKLVKTPSTMCHNMAPILTMTMYCSWDLTMCCVQTVTCHCVMTNVSMGNTSFGSAQSLPRRRSK